MPSKHWEDLTLPQRAHLARNTATKLRQAEMAFVVTKEMLDDLCGRKKPHQMYPVAAEAMDRLEVALFDAVREIIMVRDEVQEEAKRCPESTELQAESS